MHEGLFLKSICCNFIPVYVLFQQCKASSSLRGFIDQVTTSSEDKQIMLIGADCSVATEPVAELAPSWNLVQVCILPTYIIYTC